MAGGYLDALQVGTSDDLFSSTGTVFAGVKKKTFTRGMAAWVKVLLTDYLPRFRVFRPY
jgi:hypothetical protein